MLSLIIQTPPELSKIQPPGKTILISNIDPVEYSYTALLLIPSVGDVFHCCVFKTQTRLLKIIDLGRPIESFRLDSVLATRFSRLLLGRPFCLSLLTLLCTFTVSLPLKLALFTWTCVAKFGNFCCQIWKLVHNKRLQNMRALPVLTFLQHTWLGDHMLWERLCSQSVYALKAFRSVFSIQTSLISIDCLIRNVDGSVRTRYSNVAGPWREYRLITLSF